VFLSPALAKLAEVLRFSQTLAGVTLVAFGSGAPDVMTSIVASSSS